MISTRAKDPFANMIFKNNKSPMLKPVYVKRKARMIKGCRSQDSLSIHECNSHRDILPPISPSFKPAYFFESRHSERLAIKTPNFTCSAKRNKLKNFNNISEPKQIDLSFGDIEENTENVNQRILKYH